MTREEAKKWIGKLVKTMKEETRGQYPDPEYKDEVYEALDTAIQALEQEPCDKCVYSTRDGYCQYDDISETIPPLEPCNHEKNHIHYLMLTFG